MRKLVFLSLLLTFHNLPLPVLAATDWSLCSVPVVTRRQSTDYSLFATEIEANQLISENKEYIQFLGDVQLQRNKQRILADQLKLYRNPQRVQASGNLTYADKLFSLSADKLELNNSLNTGLFSQAEFQLYENHLRGSAQSIVQIDSDHSVLHDVSYTTCDPGQNTWSLSAGKLELDQQQGLGTAHNAVFRIGPVPVFYFPWFRFPINDQRMSGILAPTVAFSETDGTSLALPVYWNQAENIDMTITPIWYNDRGLQLNTENRYLFKHHQGQLLLSGLDDREFNEDRWYRQWRHEADSSIGIHTSILSQKVSDEDFLKDFDQQETIEDVDFLKSSVSFTSRISDWDVKMLFEQHQTINLAKSIASRPYKRLPRFTLDRQITPDNKSLGINWLNEWVRFDKAESITGDRLHIAPVFSYPMEGDFYFIKPSLQLDYTKYELDNNTADINSIERSLPLFSIDSGLIFERLSGSGKWTQTLEPRIYLLYVPYEDQTDIPDFDTSLLAESYSNLFVNNRFSGTDRIGDSQQVSLGLTTRLFEVAQGREILSASVGQSFYAKDRRVSLGSSIDDSDKSNLMSVIKYKPQPEWDIQLASVYDQQEKESLQTDISLRRYKNKQTFNLEYHFRRDKLEQSTLSFVYPHSNRWTSFFKRQYSIREDKPVQNLLGLAYESCCWGLKMLYEESSDKNFEETDRVIFFQLTFKGLSSAGKDIDSVLEDGILGYQPVF